MLSRTLKDKKEVLKLSSILLLDEINSSANRETNILI